jgi:L-lactate dehydrogenase complex protein LldF
MATQEIGLNEALEAAGIEPHETDLAELIVPARHDQPQPHPGARRSTGTASEIREIFLRSDAGRRTGADDDPRLLAMAARALHCASRFLPDQGRD